ncbi:MAG: hypothetical protein B6U75_00855 [Desulfurococcales archaeon ex4484_217_1]|nr:MAG: hypothetical protein B6U76_03805 [Desulfurococcales archaeon ex4484_217_2]OYT60776.1 MAG: hypothetical protein B6U75_00855 [Desulfurococcales archaeon ex4484_217_1]
MSEKFLSVKEILHEIDKLLDKEATIITRALSEIDDPLYRATLTDILSCIYTNKSQLAGLKAVYLMGAPKPSKEDKERYTKALAQSVKYFREATRLLKKLAEIEGEPRIKRYIDIMVDLWSHSVKVGRKAARKR